MPPGPSLISQLLYPRQVDNTAPEDTQAVSPSTGPSTPSISTADQLSTTNPKPTDSVVISTDPSPSSTATDSNSSSPVTATPKSSSNHAGPIAGGVIGGVILIALIILGSLLWRRRQSKRHMAPSAEFMQHHNRLQPSLSAPPLLRNMAGGNNVSDSEDEAQLPPPFTQGSFSDPIFEKLTAAAVQRQEVEQMQMYHGQPYRDEKEAELIGVGGSSGGGVTATSSLEPLRMPSL